MPGHTPQASTAPLQNLSSKLVKARHCLHAVNLQVETIRNECDKARREVEASDTEISGMEHEEERLKLQYVESAPAGHKRTSCYSRPAARMEASSPLSPQHGGRAVSRWTKLTDGPANLASRQRRHPLASISLTCTRTGKLTYEKLHASKYAKQQELKIARQGKTKTAKDSYKLKGAIETKQFEWYKAHQDHVGAEQIANALADRLEGVEKDKEAQLRRLHAQKKEVERYGNIYEDLKRELEIVQASAGAV